MNSFINTSSVFVKVMFLSTVKQCPGDAKIDIVSQLGIIFLLCGSSRAIKTSNFLFKILPHFNEFQENLFSFQHVIFLPFNIIVRKITFNFYNN